MSKAGSKMLAGAFEALLFAKDEDYHSIRDAVAAIEAVTKAGRVEVVFHSGAKGHFMWGGGVDAALAEGTEG